MKYLYAISLAVLASTVLIQCKKPTEGVQLSVNSHVLDYMISMQFYDAANPSKIPDNISVILSGTNAASVYAIDGTKTYKVNDGVLGLGIEPSAVPTEGSPVEFVAEISAPGYMSVKVPVTVLLDQKEQYKMVGMVNTSNPPKGVSVATKSAALSNNGITTTASTVSTSLTNGKEQSATITIPTGTSFYDANGVQITGSSVAVTMVHFDTRNAESINAFPGGLVTNNLTDENNNNVSGIFSTAGFARINMTVGGMAVRKFNQFIDVNMDLDPNQINPTTNEAIKAGDAIPVWSYQEETGKWKFESNQTVDNNNGKLVIKFNTNHLTWYNVGWVGSVCSSAKVNFIVSGTQNEENYVVDIYTKNNPTQPVFNELIPIKNNKKVKFTNLPSTDLIMNVYQNSPNNIPADWQHRDRSTLVGSYTGALCGNNVSVNLTVPSADTIRFKLEGKCPSGLYVYPDAVLSYRIAGGNGGYQPLGTAKKGYFETTTLKIGQTYDFKAVPNQGGAILKTLTVDKKDYDTTAAIPVKYQSQFCK